MGLFFMITEIKGSATIFQERLSREIRYSYNPHLYEYLQHVDDMLPGLPADGVSVYEVPRLIGFAFHRSDSQVLKILQQARIHHIVRTEPSGQPYAHRYKREHLLVAAALVQIRTQGVVWDNMPYALYHYLSDSELRQVINEPHEPYDPSRKWNNSEAERRRVLFDIEDQELLIKPGKIDLSSETVLSDIPADFLQQPEPLVANKESSVQEVSLPKKESILLSPERLLWLRVFLNFDSPIKPFQMDTISASKLSLGGFTLEEAEAVFKEFSSQGNSNGNMVDDDKTYYALNNAIGEILRTREINQKNTGAIS